MQSTPRGERLHIGIFGRRNAGKSSLINALTGQETALVSDTPGTTTDPVQKAMEILPIGPVLFIDTAGLDDIGDLGALRVRKSLEVLPRCDIVLLVMTADNVRNAGLELEKNLCSELAAKKISGIAVINQSDIKALEVDELNMVKDTLGLPVIQCSAAKGANIELLKRVLIENSGASWHEKSLIGDIIRPGDTAVLVVPIDDAAPKGRLILPQVQTIRDILDHDASALVVKERELAMALAGLKDRPRIVITDSQAFQKVSADTPPDVYLTSFSILFARYKGDLEVFLKGIARLEELRDGDKVLVAESCTHHVQSDDIGTVKIPRWIREMSGKELVFEKVSGMSFPDNLKDYSLVVHCGSCMVNPREVANRIAFCESSGVPITNYGMLIAHVFGILDRALAPFPHARALLNRDLL